MAANLAGEGPTSPIIGGAFFDFRNGAEVVDYDILPGLRRPPNQTAPRRRHSSLDQDEQQDLRHVRLLAEDLGRMKEEAFVVYSIVTFQLAAAVRDGDEEARDHILQRVNPSLLAYIDDIEQRISLCIEAEIDLISVRREDRPPLPYRRPQHRTIQSLSDEDARDWTRLSKAQLEDLLTHLRLRDRTFVVGRPGHTCRAKGEEMLIISLTRICTGDTWRNLVRLRFGGGVTRCWEMFDEFIDYAFVTFFHKISGNSLAQWVPQIDTFRKIMYEKAVVRSEECPIDAWMRETDLLDRPVNLVSIRDLAFALWLAWSSLDCTDWQTCRIGAGPLGYWQGASRRLNSHQLQVAFYSGYFKAHGPKYQTLLLPNGLWGSAWGAAMAHNDNGVLNMSGLTQYLEDILTPNEHGYYPTAVGDAIYPENRPTLWTTKTPRDASARFRSFKSSLSKVRQPHELHYGSFFNYFHHFRIKDQTRLYNNAEKAYRVGIVGFFLHNCFTCLKGSVVNSFFDSAHPTLAQYLPLDEDLQPYTPFAFNEHYRYRQP